MKKDSLQISFGKLLELELKHAYYENGACNDLRIEPTPDTRAIMSQWGLIWRIQTDRILVLYDRTREDILSEWAKDYDHTLKFTFRLYAQNRYFMNFTEMPTQDLDFTFYANNLNPKKQADDSLLLHNAQTLTNDDNFWAVEADFLWQPKEGEYLIEVLDAEAKVLIEKDSEGAKQVPIDLSKLPPGKYGFRINGKEIQDFVYAGETTLTPQAVIQVYPKQGEYPLFDSDNQPLAQHFTIRFAARQTYWRYFIVSKYEKDFKSLAVKGQDDLAFSSQGIAQISSGEPAWLFESEKAIPLSEFCKVSFQLKKYSSAKPSGIGKTVRKRLPAPSPELIRIRKKEGESIAKACSDIYVYI
ncbi:MAG: hypothetical protein JJT94_14690 [Bernardetiaceae bacterium]|nr:hypothetical protein [Bernardetiaceae bacterium]